VYLAPRWIDRNLTRFELLVSIVILLVLIGTFSHYSLVIYSNAERAMLNATVTNINTALRHRALLSRLESGGRVTVNFAELNPMTDMQAEPVFGGRTAARAIDLAGSVYAVIDSPPNYIGELKGPPPEGLDKGVWYFDSVNRELVYTVINTEYFRSDLSGQKRVRFRLEVTYDDNDGDGKFDPSVDHFHSINMTSPDQFEWKT